MTTLGAYLGRSFYLSHGEFDIYPNMYTMLIGSPGTRKSTAIKLAKKLLVAAGYDTIAADKTSKEKFLLDLSGDTSSTGADSYDSGRPKRGSAQSADQLLDSNLWGSDPEELAESGPDRECFVMADELNDFIGNGNVEFISLLGSLWDYSGIYRSRIKSGKSIAIKNPTINILAGNTPTGFALAFPTDILGQGFFSRLLLIYGESNGKRIPFPTRASTESTQAIVEYLRRVRQSVQGQAILSPAAEKLLERIYRSNTKVDDVRFEHYSNRRFTHLLKLSLICCAARCSIEISERDVIYANTVLSHAEHSMPRALGEFGKSRHSDVAHKILTMAESAQGLIQFKDIWAAVAQDLDKMQDLSTILQNLTAADKLQSTSGGFLPRRKVLRSQDELSVDYSLLTDEERKFVS